MVKLNIIILLSSFLLIGCRKNELINNKTLYIASGYNTQKLISEYAFENGILKEIDSIAVNDSLNVLSFDSRFSNPIIGKKIISTYGLPFDLARKEIVLMDSLGKRVLNRGFLLKSDGTDAYFYNFNNKSVIKYEVSSNKILVSENSKKFDLQLFNSFPCIDYISPDFKNLIQIYTISKDFSKPCDVFLKEIETGEETKIISSIYGTTMSINSSTFPMPSIKWIGDNEFIYTDYKRKDTMTNCIIKKYNLSDGESVIIGNIDSVPLSNSNSTFQFDKKKNLFLNTKKGIFQIDYLNNKIEKGEIKYSLNNDYIISHRNKVSKIFFNNKLIFSETDNEKLDVNWNSFKSTKGFLAIIIKRKNKGTTNFETLFKVWSESSEEWLEYKKNEFTTILGWVD